MSALPVGQREQEHQRPGPEPESAEQVTSAGAEEAPVAGTPVVVRRHAGVAALIGYAASAVAIAYLWRASQTMTVLDWVVCGVMAVIAGVNLAALVDARTPLLVADDLGVRIRLGSEWRGLPWEAIGQVVVHPRRGPFRDGRLVFAPRHLARALEGVDGKTRRHIALNQKMYGAPLAVPLGTTTRVSAADRRLHAEPTGDEDGIAEGIAALCLGRSDVILLDPATLEVVDGRREARDLDPEADPPEAAPADESQEGDEPRARKWPLGRRRPDSADEATSSPAAEGDLGQVPRQGTPERAEGKADAANQPADESAAQPRQVVFPAVGADVAWRQSEASPQSVDAGTAAADPATRAPRRSVLGGIGAIVSRVAKGRAHDMDVETDEPRAATAVEADDEASPAARAPGEAQSRGEIGAEAGAADESGADAGVAAGEASDAADGPTPGASEQAKPPFAAAALREARPGLRAEATLEGTRADDGLDGSAPETAERPPLAEGRELRRPGSVDLVFERVEAEDRVRPISTLGDPVEPLVIDDFVTEPAYDPVIGPELAAARTRLGLSVDDLAERTRIRPHVIESIEVDDFAPCGGDFYARGHLRTLARILGMDVGPLLEKFEDRYATAPINARRVFEAELATGMTGSMRSTMGGPSWGLLVGVVLCLVLVWGVLRLFATEPADVRPPVVNGSATVVHVEADGPSDGD